MKHILAFLFFVIALSATAQPYKTIKIYKPYKWMFGVHWTVIDDAGDKGAGLFDAGNTWNYHPFPTSLTVDRYFKYGWSIEGGLNYTAYDTTRIIHDNTGIGGFNFSFDVNGKFSFYNLYAPRARWIDPYVTFGLGYTYRDQYVDNHVPTFNLGGGVNFWVIKQLGIRLSAQGKLGVYPTVWDNHNNYIQLNAGIVFRTKDVSPYHYPNNKKQHKWTKERQKFKRKGGQ